MPLPYGRGSEAHTVVFSKIIRNSLPILGRIDAERIVVGFHYSNLESVLQRPELFQALGALERPHGKVRVGEQKVAAVDVQSDMFKVRGLAICFASVRNGRSREVERVARPRP